ncbi:MAG: hypothetical protein U5J83_00885 [Bryobacterales bacterium]|nr:hypothetical protein [Bryobacterales bacterium]
MAEAERSLAQAFERLGELGVYPVLQGRLADEARFALRTKAEHLAATGRTSGSRADVGRDGSTWKRPWRTNGTKQLPLALRN